MLLPYLDLLKFKVTLTALVTTLLGFCMAEGAYFDSFLLVSTLVGTFAVGGAANGLNQIIEGRTDALMRRTRERPIPSGKIKNAPAAVFCVLLGVFGFWVLYRFTNPLTAWLGAGTLFLYVFVYTPLKQKTTLNTFVGAIPGAMPILMGWTASANSISLKGMVLFFILFTWQLPHFYAIAWLYREDYRAGGHQMIGRDDPSGRATSLQIVVYTVLLVVSSFVPLFLGMARLPYAFCAAAAGLGLLALAIMNRKRDLKYARAYILASVAYLLILMISMIIDRA